MRALLVGRPLVALVAFCVLAGAATAGIALTYTNASSITTSVEAAPVQFLAGDDAGPLTLSDYVTAYSLSTNQTYMTSTLKGVPEATVLIDSFSKLTNVDDTSRTVTLSTSQVTNSYVTAYTLRVYNATNVLQGTLDFRADSPATTFTLPAGATYRAEVTLTLASGAGANNVALSNGVTLIVA